MKFNEKYFVVRFLEKPYSTIDSEVCVPFKWLKLAKKTTEIVSVAYPDEYLPSTRGMVRDIHTQGDEWRYYKVQVKCVKRSFKAAERYIKSRNQIKTESETTECSNTEINESKSAFNKNCTSSNQSSSPSLATKNPILRNNRSDPIKLSIKRSMPNISLNDLFKKPTKTVTTSELISETPNHTNGSGKNFNVNKLVSLDLDCLNQEQHDTTGKQSLLVTQDQLINEQRHPEKHIGKPSELNYTEKSIYFQNYTNNETSSVQSTSNTNHTIKKSCKKNHLLSYEHDKHEQFSLNSEDFSDQEMPTEEIAAEKMSENNHIETTTCPETYTNKQESNVQNLCASINTSSKLKSIVEESLLEVFQKTVQEIQHAKDEFLLSRKTVGQLNKAFEQMLIGRCSSVQQNNITESVSQGPSVKPEEKTGRNGNKRSNNLDLNYVADDSDDDDDDNDDSNDSDYCVDNKYKDDTDENDDDDDDSDDSDYCVDNKYKDDTDENDDDDDDSDDSDYCVDNKYKDDTDETDDDDDVTNNETSSIQSTPNTSQLIKKSHKKNHLLAYEHDKHKQFSLNSEDFSDQEMPTEEIAAEKMSENNHIETTTCPEMNTNKQESKVNLCALINTSSELKSIVEESLLIASLKSVQKIHHTNDEFLVRNTFGELNEAIEQMLKEIDRCLTVQQNNITESISQEQQVKPEEKLTENENKKSNNLDLNYFADDSDDDADEKDDSNDSDFCVDNKYKDDTDENDDDDDESDDDDDENDDSLCEPPKKTPGKKRSFVLPPEYNAHDSRWTLKYQAIEPGVVELVPHSKIYISDLKLANCKRIARDYKAFGRTLLVEIFSRNALSVCSLTGARANAFDVHDSDIRPGLDEEARSILLTYVEEYGRNQGWGQYDTQSVVNSLRSKIQLMRSKYGSTV